MFGIGSLNYLHTFAEVSHIYKIEQSTLRKKVARGELKIDVDVKKFGGTWVITENAMVKHFGVKPFVRYMETGEVATFKFARGNNNKQMTERQKREAEGEIFF